MSSHIHRTYRITIDITTTFYPGPSDTIDHASLDARSHAAIIERLQAHPEVLEPLLRSLVIEKMDEAKKLLNTVYGNRTPEHEHFQPIIAELEPEAQAYLMEELEDGYQAYYFDGFATTIKRFHMTSLEGENS